MKIIAAIAVLLVGLIIPAQASVTTYYWHQTWSSLPNLAFSGRYSVLDPAMPVIADSYEAAPDLSGLVGFYVEGGQVEPVRLSDLVPTCWVPGPDCLPGLPIWNLNILGADPALRFLDARASYDYWIGADTIAANTDRGGPCFWTGACYVKGYWSTAAVPAPATLPVLFVGLFVLFGLIRVGRGRIRS